MARARRKGGRRRTTKKRGPTIGDRLQILMVVLVFTAVGALLGSFWLEWREPRLGAGPSGMPSDLDTGTVAEREQATPADPLAARLRVEVLNGSGDRGAAESVADHLRDLGFDVVYWGNADLFDQEVTHVINRSGVTGAAGEIAAAIGSDSTDTAVDEELHLDATVILGKDWRSKLQAIEANG